MPVRKVPSKKIIVSTRPSSGGKKTSRVAVAPSKNIVRAKSRATSLSVPVYSLAGNTSGTISLPKEVFGAKVNKTLLVQAVRVYSTNQKVLPGSTKRRGEVHGTTAKVWKQKGTGRARHGARTAPIFVGGGVAFGPKPRKIELHLPPKMKKAALISALSQKAADQQIVAISDLEKATGKTKQMVKLILKLNTKSALVIAGAKSDLAARATRNLPGINLLPCDLVNAYDVIKHNLLVIGQDAIDKLGKRTK